MTSDIYFSFFADGLSNTIFATEAIACLNQSDRRIRGGTVIEPAINDLGAGRANPAACLIVRDPLNPSQFTNSPDSWWGESYADGRPAATGCTTTTPPNSPTCSWAAWGDGVWVIAPPSSNHTGGVNVLMGDGSVSFISETIDCNGSTLPQPYAGGRSPYGVFGALGLPAGGESAALP